MRPAGDPAPSASAAARRDAVRHHRRVAGTRHPTPTGASGRSSCRHARSRRSAARSLRARPYATPVSLAKSNRTATPLTVTPHRRLATALLRELENVAADAGRAVTPPASRPHDRLHAAPTSGSRRPSQPPRAAREQPRSTARGSTNPPPSRAALRRSRGGHARVDSTARSTVAARSAFSPGTPAPALRFPS